jgi:hypothetical protein
MIHTLTSRGRGLLLAAVFAILCLVFPATRAVSMPTAGGPLTPALVAGNPDDKDDDDDRDPVMLKFSSVGDSRQDPVAPDPTTTPVSGQDAIWLQNSKAFSRILDTIHEQKSSILFFNGDMIMGYGKASLPPINTTIDGIVGSDLMAFYRQYAFWRGMVARTMETGTYVVPVPGNHETQYKAGGKKAQVENENAWRANMGDLILDDARFAALLGAAPTSEDTGNTGALDGLSSDQSKLSFSFDLNGMHFAVINTDPVGKDAHAPTKWLTADLAAAKARGVGRSFVFGHKPAYTYYYGVPPTSPLPATPSGLDGDTAARDAFWDVIESNGAIYFCGHEHIFNLMQPRGKAWQILVGSGGSPFEAKVTDSTLSPTDRDYAWVTVRVHKSGKVKISAYGFSDLYGPTALLQTITIH